MVDNDHIYSTKQVPNKWIYVQMKVQGKLSGFAFILLGGLLHSIPKCDTGLR